jgi:hypothetical protein
MNRFIFKFTCFIFPLVLVFFVIEYKLSQLENSYTFKQRQMVKSINEVEVLNLGSSHANNGLDPDFYSYKGFNLANVSQSFYYDYCLFEKYVEQTESLKLVLIPVSYFSLGYNMIESEESWRQFFYKRFNDIPIENEFKDIEIRNYSLFFLYGSLTSFKYLLKGFKIKLAENYKENGFYMGAQVDLQKKIKNFTDKQGKKIVLRHNQAFDKKNSQDNFLYIEKIIIQSKKRGIIPVLITIPTYKTYYNNIDQETWKITQEIISRLEKTYGITYYNYLRDSRFNKEDFADDDHLNFKGAEKFSKIVNEEILKVRIKQNK